MKTQQKEYLFYDSRGAQLKPKRVVEEILQYMAADTNRSYTITIGSDSEQFADKRADFVTAIVIHRVGNGARYFWRRLVSERPYHSLRDRMYEEVSLSLEIAQHFLSVAKAMKLEGFQFEIHIDIGKNGATKTMIAELTGMIRANNFIWRIKPESYAASKVADRHAHAAASH
ncbi:MAG: ribonuclease H-like YkuK family protein [Candidatus Harrisonbacteria bacterium]|nr:ribonuclease H-like YkuK family protein [Candidatus Harrisonbacteria bacterium]